MQFIKTGKFKQDIEVDYIEEIYWELTVNYKTGRPLSLASTKPDSDDFKGDHIFDKFIEWFMCSDNPYFRYRFNNGSRVYIRTEIQTIEVNRVVKEKEIKDA